MIDTDGTGPADDEDQIDGRTLRRDRNRIAVITALLDLIREGELHPGAVEIAERAGVSHRSIFRYFDDLDDLARTAIDTALTEAAPYIGIPDIGCGGLGERVDAFVEARVALSEHLDGAMQLARIRASSIPAIGEALSELAAKFREQIARHFAAELDVLTGDERPLLVDAALVLTSHDSYTIHTRSLHSDGDYIRAAWAAALVAMFD